MENSQPFEDVSGKNLNRWEIVDNANCKCGENKHWAMCLSVQ